MNYITILNNRNLSSVVTNQIMVLSRRNHHNISRIKHRTTCTKRYQSSSQKPQGQNETANRKNKGYKSIIPLSITNPLKSQQEHTPQVVHYLVISGLYVCLFFNVHFGILTKLVLGVGIVGGIGYANFKNAFRKSDPVYLIGTPFSPFVEKVRWLFDIGGVRYKEVPNMVLLGLLYSGVTSPTVRIGKTVLGDSQDITLYFSAKNHNQGIFYMDDHVREMETYFNRLGENTRRFLYYHVFQLDPKVAIAGFQSKIVPGQKVLVNEHSVKMIKWVISKSLRITKDRYEKSLEEIDECFRRVEAMLRDGRRHICGHEFTIADISFCSAATLLLLPPELEVFYYVLPQSAIEVVERYRNTEAGKYVMRMYREHRHLGQNYNNTY